MNFLNIYTTFRNYLFQFTCTILSFNPFRLTITRLFILIYLMDYLEEHVSYLKLELLFGPKYELVDRVLTI